MLFPTFRNSALLGALIDFILYFIFSGVGLTPTTAATLSFIGASLVYYVWSLHFREIFKGDAGWALHEIFNVACLVLMLLSLRGGFIFAISNATALHPIISFLPALIVTVLTNQIYLRFVSQNENNQKAVSLVLWWLLFFVISVRVLFLGALELIPEEAYYWHYARYLSPGYLDHPPMVGWLIALGVKSFGLNEFGVRFFALVCTIFSAGFIALLHRRIFGTQGLLFTVVLALSIPYCFGAGFFVSPDAPLTLFWAAGLYFLHRSLCEGKLSDWILFGIAIGFGMLSKYTIVLLGIPALVLMISVSEWRRCLRQPGPYVAALVALIVFSPVLYWNMMHEWASFVFQGPRRFNSTTAFSLHEYLLDMICLVTPSIFLAVVPAMLFYRNEKSEKSTSKNTLFGSLCFLLPASVFAFYSLRHVPKLNWSGPSFLAVLPFIGYWIASSISKLESCSKYSRIVLRSIAPVFFVWLSLAGLALHYLGVGLPAVPYSQKMHRVIGWRSMTEAMLDVSNKVQAEAGQKPVFAGMDKHNIASEIAFYGAKRLGLESMNLVGSRNIIGDEALMFRYWSPPETFIGKPIILIAKEEGDLSEERLVKYFDRIGPLTSVPLKTGWSSTKTYLYRVGYGYRGIHPTEEKKVLEVSPTPEAPQAGETATPAEPLTSEQTPQFTPAPPGLNRS